MFYSSCFFGSPFAAPFFTLQNAYLQEQEVRSYFNDMLVIWSKFKGISCPIKYLRLEISLLKSYSLFCLAHKIMSDLFPFDTMHYCIFSFYIADEFVLWF